MVKDKMLCFTLHTGNGIPADKCKVEQELESSIAEIKSLKDIIIEKDMVISKLTVKDNSRCCECGMILSERHAGTCSIGALEWENYQLNKEITELENKLFVLTNKENL